MNELIIVNCNEGRDRNIKNTMEICIYSSNFIKQITNESLTYPRYIREEEKSELKKNIRQRQLIQER